MYPSIRIIPHQQIHQVYLSVYSSFMSVCLTHVCVWLWMSSLSIYQSVHHVYSSINLSIISMYLSVWLSNSSLLIYQLMHEVYSSIKCIGFLSLSLSVLMHEVYSSIKCIGVLRSIHVSMRSIHVWGLFIYQVYRCIKCIGLPPNSLYAYRLRPPSLNSWNSRKGLLVLTPHTTFYFDSRQNIWFWLYTRHLCGL